MAVLRTNAVLENEYGPLACKACTQPIELSLQLQAVFLDELNVWISLAPHGALCGAGTKSFIKSVQVAVGCECLCSRSILAFF